MTAPAMVESKLRWFELLMLIGQATYRMMETILFTRRTKFKSNSVTVYQPIAYTFSHHRRITTDWLIYFKIEFGIISLIIIYNQTRLFTQGHSRQKNDNVHLGKNLLKNHRTVDLRCNAVTERAPRLWLMLEALPIALLCALRQREIISKYFPCTCTYTMTFNERYTYTYEPVNDQCEAR
jgi:hypothetical protein